MFIINVVAVLQRWYYNNDSTEDPNWFNRLLSDIDDRYSVKIKMESWVFTILTFFLKVMYVDLSEYGLFFYDSIGYI